MKNKFFSYLGLFLILSCNQNQSPLHFISKFNVQNAIKIKVSDALSESDCIPIAITEDGYCLESDTSTVEIYLKRNSTLNFKELVQNRRNTMEFCYSYKKKNEIFIRFNHAISPSGVTVLDVKIENDSFQIRHSLILTYKNEVVQAFTEQQNLILNKEKYVVGDTIFGYLSFKGYDDTKYKVQRNLSGYFRCVVGNSEAPIDNVKTYDSCAYSLSGKPKRAEMLALRLKEREEFKRAHN